MTAPPLDTLPLDAAIPALELPRPLNDTTMSNDLLREILELGDARLASREYLQGPLRAKRCDAFASSLVLKPPTQKGN